MRKTLALAALGAAAAATLLPVSSASASCIDAGIGGCLNPCFAAASAYGTVDTTAGDKLPNVELICVA